MQTDNPKTRRTLRNAGILLGAFLLGLIPMLVRNLQLQRELASTRSALELSETRDVASLAFLEASRNNYGLAASHTSRLYDRLDKLAQQGEEPARSVARDALGKRDAVMQMLATADTGARNELMELTNRLLSSDSDGNSARARSK